MYSTNDNIYKRILYFSVLGTLFITNRPSYDSDAKTQGSADDHSTAYTLSSCSSYVAMTPSAGGLDDLKKRVKYKCFVAKFLIFTRKKLPRPFLMF